LVKVSPEHRDRWRQRLVLPSQAKVIAYFGALSAAKQFKWVTEAWKHSQSNSAPTALVVIGGKPTWNSPASLRHLYRPLGYQSPDDVSNSMQAVDLLALPFIDGVSERRTSFMAGLSHRCPVATTLGPNTGPT